MICVKKSATDILMGSCDCQKCVDIFDDQWNYVIAHRPYCNRMKYRGPDCKCFE